MIGCCKGAVRLGVLAVVMMMALPQSVAQTCRVFEREMETLFMNHEPQSPVPRQELERIRARCPEPSRKMLLIYYFFRAVDAYQSSNLSDREAYDRAVTYYNRSAENFLLLTEYELEDPFFQTFYSRAEELEGAIQELAYEAGVDSRYARSQGTVDISQRGSSYGSRMLYSDTYRTTRSAQRQQPEMQVEWNRENVILPAREEIDFTHSNARNGKPQEADSWAMSFSRDTRNSARTSGFRGSSGTHTRTSARTRSIDSYPGVSLVGTLDQIDPISYLHHNHSSSIFDQQEADLRRGIIRGGSSSTPNPNELWQYRYTNPQSSGTNVRTTRGSTGVPSDMNMSEIVYVNVASATAITIRPGKSSPSVSTLEYGEAVYRVADASPSFQQGEQYVQVQTVNGQVGWVSQNLLVPDGRLAVVIRSVNGITSGGDQVTFFPAEPIVLARYENGRALVVGQDAQKQGWISDLPALSISEEDLRLADMIATAMSHTSIYARMAGLRDIQRHPVYAHSPLAAVVDRLVAEEAQRQ